MKIKFILPLILGLLFTFSSCGYVKAKEPDRTEKSVKCEPVSEITLECANILVYDEILQMEIKPLFKIEDAGIAANSYQIIESETYRWRHLNSYRQLPQVETKKKLNTMDIPCNKFLSMEKLDKLHLC